MNFEILSKVLCRQTKGKEKDVKKLKEEAEKKKLQNNIYSTQERARDARRAICFPIRT